MILNSAKTSWVDTSSSKPQLSTLRSKLKEATMASHTEIESNPTLAKLTSPSLTESDYKFILSRYFGFFSPLEAQLRERGAANLVPDFEMRVRAPRLFKDLRALGLSETDIAGLQTCNALPSVESDSKKMGVMYVTEGSTLGGMLIAKHLRTMPFFNEENGHFFTENPQSVSARWKAFIEKLESSAGSLNEAETLKSATETFDKLDAWMSADPNSGR
ncbi:MAG: hypothetical protein EOP05_11200 [Proteobacteria bacterium]|nr:MAG: hypothetical protein EOP05_11200 [Pseudomonadota bacterium]